MVAPKRGLRKMARPDSGRSLLSRLHAEVVLLQRKHGHATGSLVERQEWLSLENCHKAPLVKTAFLSKRRARV